MPDAPPKALIDAIARGEALVICGAGVSSAATGGAAPGWAKLIREALEESAKPGGGMSQAWAKGCAETLKSEKNDDWLSVADIVQAKLGGVRGGAYRAFFVQRLGKLTASRPAIIEAIARLQAHGNRVATTNYDHLLSQAPGLPTDRAEWTDPQRVVEALRGERPAIWHLHGDFDHPESVVFSQRDYDRMVATEFPQFVQRSAGLNFTLVFVGCSGSGLSDDNVGALLNWLRAGFSGLGDRHFALTADDNKDVWPKGVEVVRFGAHDDLPAYLAKLAPPPAPSRAAFPPDPAMIGRADRLEELATAILAEDRPIIVPGGPGIGKTTLALAAAWDARVLARFGAERRVFVNCEPARDADTALRAIAESLGLPAAGPSSEVETRIGAQVLAQERLVILDNFETPWRGDDSASEALLARLAAVPGLRLVVTVRGSVPHVGGRGANTLRDVERLPEAEARWLFLRHAGEHFGADPALDALLANLEGHPLSIELLAANAEGAPSLEALAAEWKRRRAAMLERGKGDHRLTSLSVSLEISLAALKPGSPAHRLARVMALLPDGLADADAEALLAETPADAERAAVGILGRARLASLRAGRWRMLAPLRETLALAHPPEPADRARLVARFLTRAALGEKIGTNAWPSIKAEVDADAGNFDAVVALGAKISPPAAGLAAAAVGLVRFHIFTGLGAVRSLPSAVAALLASGDLRGTALCSFGLGNVSYHRNDIERAQALIGEAQTLFRQVNDVVGEADCIQTLGEIAKVRSEYQTAHTNFAEALQLFKQAHATLGEANCLLGLGDIAFLCGQIEPARSRYVEAKPLYEKVGATVGIASCLRSLASVAVMQSDPDEASARFSEALPLYRQMDSRLGEANCIKGLGDVALMRGIYKTACSYYGAAATLYKQVGFVLGEANCLQRLGDALEQECEVVGAMDQWRKALQIYERITNLYSIGGSHWRLAKLAAGPEAETHRAAARKAWESIGRTDLIEKYL